MQSSAQRHSPEFIAFFGTYEPDFSSVHPEKVEQLLQIFNAGLTDEAIQQFKLLFSEDGSLKSALDPMVIHAAYAFSKQRLTPHQLANLLELRVLLLEFDVVKIIPLLNHDADSFTEDERRILADNFVTANLDKFYSLLKNKPASERCLYVVEEKSADDKKFEKIEKLLTYANNLRIISQKKYRDLSLEEKANPTINFTYPCMGVRDALTELRFGVHKKSAFPRVGPLTKEDIEASVRKMGRYVAEDYPGAPREKIFHGIEIALSGFTYLMLHDELHRQIASSIPILTYVEFIAAIDLIRKKTGFVWSREVWDGFDMELTVFLDEPSDTRDKVDEKHCTENFLKIVSAIVASESRKIGLFTPSPYIETTWLLLIDFFENEKSWRALFINPAYFPEDHPYHEIYQFILNNKTMISACQTPAAKVGRLMNAYFSAAEEKSSSEDQDENIFCFKVKERYIQLMEGKDIILLPKKTILEHDIFLGGFKVPKQVAKRLTSETLELLNSSHILRKLVEDGILTYEQLVQLPYEKLSAIDDSFYIVRHLESGKLTFEKLKEISIDKLRLIDNFIIVGYIERGVFSFDQLIQFSEKKLELLGTPDIERMFDEGILTSEKFINFPEERLSYLVNQRKISAMFVAPTINIPKIGINITFNQLKQNSYTN